MTHRNPLEESRPRDREGRQRVALHQHVRRAHLSEVSSRLWQNALDEFGELLSHGHDPEIRGRSETEDR
jgi:hypothetical protein